MSWKTKERLLTQSHRQSATLTLLCGWEGLFSFPLTWGLGWEAEPLPHEESESGPGQGLSQGPLLEEPEGCLGVVLPSEPQA